MDIQLYLKVFWRFKLIVLLGLIFAFALTVLAVVRVSVVEGKPQLVYRESEEWGAFSQIYVTQQGCPACRSIIDPEQLPARVRKELQKLGLQFADPGRFSALAVFYSNVATSDPVIEIMKKKGPIDGTIEAAPILSQTAFAEALPLISILALSHKPDTAVELSVRATAALKTYLKEQQDAADIPEEYRVQLIDMKVPREAELMAGRSITVPMLVFISVMIVTLGLCLILENLRPRVRPELLAAQQPVVDQQQQQPQAAAGGIR